MLLTVPCVNHCPVFSWAVALRAVDGILYICLVRIFYGIFKRFFCFLKIYIFPFYLSFQMNSVHVHCATVLGSISYVVIE